MTSSKMFSMDNPKVFNLIICRTKGNIFSELDGEAVILNISSGIYSGLNPVGTFIWAQLEQPITIATLRDAIVREYDISEELCSQDLFHFLNDLADNNLVCIVN